MIVYYGMRKYVIQLIIKVTKIKSLKSTTITTIDMIKTGPNISPNNMTYSNNTKTFMSRKK